MASCGRVSTAPVQVTDSNRLEAAPFDGTYMLVTPLTPDYVERWLTAPGAAPSSPPAKKLLAGGFFVLGSNRMGR
jgi:hypothetical protein